MIIAVIQSTNCTYCTTHTQLDDDMMTRPLYDTKRSARSPTHYREHTFFSSVLFSFLYKMKITLLHIHFFVCSVGCVCCSCVCIFFFFFFSPHLYFKHLKQKKKKRKEKNVREHKTQRKRAQSFVQQPMRVENRFSDVTNINQSLASLTGIQGGVSQP